MLMFEPLAATMDKNSPSDLIGNTTLDPLNSEENSSKTWNSPTDHALNESPSTLSTVSSKLSRVFVGSVGIPTVPPIPIVNVCPTLYPNPVLEILNSTTLDPCPTTMSTLPPVPTPVEFDA